MNNLKCPFCGQELHHYEPLGLYMCKTCFVDCRLGQQDFGTKGLWQELIRTRKALEMALKELKQLKYGGKADRTYLKNKAGKALEQITALKQKD